RMKTPHENRFDHITALGARLFDVPLAAISLWEPDGARLQACQGADGGPTDAPPALGAWIDGVVEPLIVPDTHTDPRFAHSPFVTGEPHLRFYIAMPLRAPDGAWLGALCLWDHRPRAFSREQQAHLQSLAALAAGELERRNALQRQAQAEAQIAR